MITVAMSHRRVGRRVNCTLLYEKLRSDLSTESLIAFCEFKYSSFLTVSSHFPERKTRFDGSKQITALLIFVLT